MRVAPAITLSGEQKQTLEQYARGRSPAARVVERAKIVLLAATGKQDLEIAATLGITNQKSARWRARFLKFGVTGLEKDAPRPGRTPSIPASTVRKVVELTTRSKPENSTHWSTRTMALKAGVSEASVRRIWHSHGFEAALDGDIQNQQ